MKFERARPYGEKCLAKAESETEASPSVLGLGFAVLLHKNEGPDHDSGPSLRQSYELDEEDDQDAHRRLSSSSWVLCV